MSTVEVAALITSLKEWEAILEDAKNEVESLKDSIKMEMESRDIVELETSAGIVRYTIVQSFRFDTRRFKVEIGEEVYKRFCKEVTSRRFTVSG